MKPQEPIPHNYSMRRLNLIFALSSLVLLAVTGGIVMYDYVRGWKWFQYEFMRIQNERLRQELQVAEEAQSKTQVAELDRQVREQETQIARHRQEHVLAQKELDSWEGRHDADDQDYRFAKARLDASRYELEAAITQRRGNRRQKQREFDELNQHVNDLTLRLQDVTRKRDAAQARVDVWLHKIKEAEDKKKELNASIDLLGKQLAGVSATKENILLNLPMLD